MGSGGKGAGGAGKSHDYFGTIVGLVGGGPFDDLVSLIVDSKVAWPKADEWKAGNNYTAGKMVAKDSRVWKCKVNHLSSAANQPPSSIHWQIFTVRRTDVGVNNPYPFTVEGYGEAYFYWGTADQVLDTVGEKFLSDNGHPAYRRQGVMVLKNFLFGRERVSAPNIEVVARKNPNQSIIGGGSQTNDDEGQANPIAAWCDLIADPVFGLGQPDTLIDADSFQSVADALAANKSRTYISPFLDNTLSFREFTAGLLCYYDGFMRFNESAQIVAGRFLHNEAPPAFTPATTIDFHDLVEEIQFDSKGWAETSNETTVKFIDSARAFKDASVKAPSGYNKAIVEEPREMTIERPWIMRRQQAQDHASEWGRINAEPSMGGNLVVRAEKAANIQVGSLFLLNHDALGMSVVCRCLGRTIPAPPSGTVKIRFENERGIAPQIAQSTPTSYGGTAPRPLTPIVHYQFVQPPPLMSEGADFFLAVLASRPDPTIIGLNLHLKKDDASVFYLLGGQRNWAVFGTLTQAYAANLPAPDTNPPDDTTETLQITIPADIPQADIDKISQTQSADAVNDNSLVAFVFQAATPENFEVMTVIEFRLDAGVYKLKVRRARFGTKQLAFATDDRVFLMLRSDLTAYGHNKFADYAPSGSASTFRLQPFDVHSDADLGDATVCPDIAYTFSDPYAPIVEWISTQKNFVEMGSFELGTVSRSRTANVARIVCNQNHNFTNGDRADADGLGGVGFNIANVTVTVINPTTFTYPSVGADVALTADTGGTISKLALINTDRFTLTMKITDPSADLNTASIIGKLGSLETLLWQSPIAPSSVQYKTIDFALPYEGDWRIQAYLKSQFGRVSTAFLTEVGGATEAFLRMTSPTSNTVATPKMNPSPGGYKTLLNFTISCATPGATIQYEARPLNAAPTGAWTNYTGAFFSYDSATQGTSIYVRATKAGMNNSATTKNDYYYAP